jgi:hypothetical protein
MVAGLTLGDLELVGIGVGLTSSLMSLCIVFPTELGDWGWDWQAIQKTAIATNLINSFNQLIFLILGNLDFHVGFYICEFTI